MDDACDGDADDSVPLFDLVLNELMMMLMM